MMREWISALAVAGVVVFVLGSAHSADAQQNEAGRQANDGQQTFQRLIDLNTIASDKAGFVASIVSSWAASLEDGGAELTAGLMALTPDRLIAARAARTAEDLDTVIRGGRGPYVLGDGATDLVFFPVVPCRIVDTRVAGGALLADTQRNFDAQGSFAAQGGSATSCGLPGSDTAALVLTITATNTAGTGNLRAFPKDAPLPLASVLNYRAGVDIASGVILPMKQSGADLLEFTIRADAAATAVVIDVTGYFWFASLPTAGRAFAKVLPGASPSFDPGRTKGFSAVNRPSVGQYCLTPSPAIDPITVPATVSVDWSNSSGSLLAVFMRDSGAACVAGQFNVATYDFAGNLTDNVAFHIFVP